MTTNLGMINMDTEINGYRYERNSELLARIKNSRDQQNQYQDLRLYTTKVIKDVSTTKAKDNKNISNIIETDSNDE